MKVENLHSTSNSSYVYQRPKIQQEKGAGISGGRDSNQTQVHQDKLRIPENYQAKRINLARTINKQEQAYFEKMYPSHKTKIRAYLNQQEASVPVKGQFVDIRR